MQFAGLKTNEDWALAYLEHGYSVLPAHRIDSDGLCSCGKTVCTSPGKHPRLQTWTRWQQERPSEEQVHQWWSRWPNANVAIVTGRVSGIVVVDVDPAHGGDGKDLNVNLETVTCLTGGGGQHYYYRHPGTATGNRGAIIPGIDLRGDGGYVIAPPSNHYSGGRYQWEEGWSPWDMAELLPFPTEINQIDPMAEIAHHPNFDAEIARLCNVGVPEGQRNVFLTRVAGHYFGQGETYEKTMQLVLGVNGQACRPMLDYKEVQAIVDSIHERDKRQREQKALLAALQASEISVLTPEERLEYARNAWAELGIEGVFDWYKTISVDSVGYTLELTDRSCSLDHDLLNMSGVRTKILNTLNVLLPRVKPAEWDRQMERLVLLAREEQTGAMKVQEQVQDWMSEYLQDIQEVDEDLRFEALQRARSARPILIDGVPYLRLPHFQLFLEQRFGEKLSGKEIGTYLRQGGWESAIWGEQRLRVWRRCK